MSELDRVCPRTQKFFPKHRKSPGGGFFAKTVCGFSFSRGACAQAQANRNRSCCRSGECAKPFAQDDVQDRPPTRSELVGSHLRGERLYGEVVSSRRPTLAVRSEIGPYRRPSQRYLALPKIIRDANRMKSSFPSTDGESQVRRSEVAPGVCRRRRQGHSSSLAAASRLKSECQNRYR